MGEGKTRSLALASLRNQPRVPRALPLAGSRGSAPRLACTLAFLLTAAPAAWAAELPPAPVSPMQQEVWAGISYGDALTGLALLAGGGVVVAWATGSTAVALTVAAAAAITFVAYDPGPVPPVTAPSEALPELVPGRKD
jgi:hypothetical protein